MSNLTLKEFRELTNNLNENTKILINFDTDLGSGTDFATNLKEVQGNIIIYC